MNKTIYVNVSLNDASVSVEDDTLELKVDGRYDFNATTVPRFLDVEYVSGNESVATVTDYGIVTAVGEGTAVITVEVGDGEICAKNSTTVNVTVSKISTEIESSAVTTVYNVDKNLIVTLKDANGNPISGASITVDLNGDKHTLLIKTVRLLFQPKVWLLRHTLPKCHSKETKSILIQTKMLRLLSKRQLLK